MPPPAAGPMIWIMTSVRHLVVELDVITGRTEAIQGRARAPGLAPRSFSGWSELFAVLQTMVTGTEEAPEPGRDSG